MASVARVFGCDTQIRFRDCGPKLIRFYSPQTHTCANEAHGVNGLYRSEVPSRQPHSHTHAQRYSDTATAISKYPRDSQQSDIEPLPLRSLPANLLGMSSLMNRFGSPRSMIPP